MHVFRNNDVEGGNTEVNSGEYNPKFAEQMIGQSPESTMEALNKEALGCKAHMEKFSRTT